MDAAAADPLQAATPSHRSLVKTSGSQLRRAPFFELPDAVKRKAIAPKRQATRGYSPPNAENYAALGGVANQAERRRREVGARRVASCSAATPQKRRTASPWPREANHRDALVAFGEEAAAAAVRLIEEEAAPAAAGPLRRRVAARRWTINGYGFAGAPG